MYGTARKRKKATKKNKEIDKKNRLSLKKKRLKNSADYDSDKSDSNAELDHAEDVFNLDDDDKFNFVMEPSGQREILLPEYIELDDPYPGEPPIMKKRSFPAVLRFHKFKASVQPDDYWFAEALLYTPFRSEEELEERVAEAAKDGYILLNEQIQAVKSQVMEHLESTEEARFMIQEALNNDSDVGAVLNPSGEQDNDDCELEELLLHPDYQHLDPAEYLAIENNPVEKTYRPIVIDSLTY